MEVFGLVDIPVQLILAITAVVLLYIYSTWTFDFFRKQGIPGPRPYPLFGNNTQVVLAKLFHKWKQTYGKIFGIFVGREPVFVVSDLDILKEVFVKSFNNFRNRRKSLVSTPLNMGVFFLEDDAWKRVRNIITPTFSGAKLRAMCPAINDCATTLLKNFNGAVDEGEPVNMKQYFGAFTMDVISRTAFGVKVDSQNDFNDPFTSHAKKLFTPNQARRSLILLSSLFPYFGRLLRHLRIAFNSTEVGTFFSKIILEMVEQRKKESLEKSDKKVDFLQLLIDAEISDTKNGNSPMANGHVSNGHGPESAGVRCLTTDEIVGQGMLFFIAGYETTASTLNFASYSLATNPDVQEKAYNEIRDVLGDEEPNYDNINNLKYLEHVIFETLRLFPPVTSLTRTATERITIKGITIPRGFSVFIPVMAIQRDPGLFEDPEKFKPERHADKNNPLSFLSFGFGPRICIGMRLALVEIKIALVHVMRRFRFEATDVTPKNMIFSNNFILQPEKENKLKLIPREKC